MRLHWNGRKVKCKNKKNEEKKIQTRLTCVLNFPTSISISFKTKKKRHRNGTANGKRNIKEFALISQIFFLNKYSVFFVGYKITFFWFCTLSSIQIQTEMMTIFVLFSVSSKISLTCSDLKRISAKRQLNFIVLLYFKYNEL